MSTTNLTQPNASVSLIESIVDVSLVPASSAATGKKGSVVLGSNGYIYVCVADNTWRRVQLAIF